MFTPGDRVAVAVSGGSDSLALLRLLQHHADEWGLQLAVAHFDHGWRADSAADAEFVASLAGQWGLPFHLGRAPASGVTPVAANPEQAARRARYAFFQGLIESGIATRVATGHTADDQAETVLLRLFRGAGSGGLAGILPTRDGHAVGAPGQAGRAAQPREAPRPSLVRPLLPLRRAELQTWLRALGQPWREDATNADVRRRRNWLRHEILPRIESVHPDIVERLNVAADIATTEEQFWEDWIPPLADSVWTSTPHGLLADLHALRAQPLAVRRRLLRYAAARLQARPRPISYVQLEAVLEAIATTASRDRHFQLGGVPCRISAHLIELERRDLGYT